MRRLEVLNFLPSSAAAAPGLGGAAVGQKTKVFIADGPSSAGIARALDIVTGVWLALSSSASEPQLVGDLP